MPIAHLVHLPRIWSSSILALVLAVSPAIKLAAASAESVASHWAFQAPSTPVVPVPKNSRSCRTEVDRFAQARLEKAGLSLGPRVDRATLLRRVTLLTTGLPPTPAEIANFIADRSVPAYDKVIDRLLASPRYAEKWARHWLDAAGYADSNGYFSADSDRPLAYRYRDYVVRALQRDTPFDEFVREQLAGDQLTGWKPGQPATAQIVELLEATHFLRNGQDGSGESDGNDDEVRSDRYYALESSVQIFGSSLLGLTVQCAKCHDHKFEPITQRDYYSLQAYLFPAFHPQKWVKPNDRFVYATLPGEMETWEADDVKLTRQANELTQSFQQWVATHRPRGRILFEDSFAEGSPLAERWSNVAPGDDAPAGTPPVALDSARAPAAQVRSGRLEILESGGAGDRWISTRDSFNWRPAATGDWIQVTFDLVADRIAEKGRGAERVGYLVGLHDFSGNGVRKGGNILIDGNPAGPTTVYGEYPHSGSKAVGNIGSTGYTSGHNYGIRISRPSDKGWRMEHLVDGVVDGVPLELKGELISEGGFGFEFCCGRSFVVDEVRVESSMGEHAAWAEKNRLFEVQLAARRKEMEERLKAITGLKRPKPGKISWVSDLGPEAPKVPLLKRGDHRYPGEVVEPAPPAFLSKTHPASLPERTETGTGARLSLARWLTEPRSPQSALLARVTMNRLWQQYFGVGIVATPDNLGLSGSRPIHPELLEWISSEFIASGWSMKAMHRLLLRSAMVQQSSLPTRLGNEKDPSNQWLWRFPIRRLEAEAIRDSTLAVSGRLDLSKTLGAYVPTSRAASGEVVLDEALPGAFARSLFLQQRRSQVATQLGLFDAPSVVFNCTRRAQTTMPLQSLSLLNSEFSLRRAEDMAWRLEREAGKDTNRRIQLAFLLTTGRPPDTKSRGMVRDFLISQRKLHLGAKDAEFRTWADLCQMLLASSPFLYLD